jgi:3-hydroxyisobutyrate dehydrogenase-like beta-hydroxyacid dehydrogenase
VIERVAIVGFGEVGQILADDLTGLVELSAWDVLFRDPASKPSAAAANRPGVRVGQSAGAAVRGAQLVISAVTASQDLAAAEAAAEGIEPGAYFLDLNSCSPGQKVASAGVIEAAAGRYVEAAVMASLPPRRIASPMLLGGPHIHDFLEAARGLGFAGASAYSETLGRSAATKLCRSVIVKGLEAILTESMLAARHYGVEDVVLDSLSDVLSPPNWPLNAKYMISRSLEHGVRRAEEMREAARTVAEANVPPTMSEAIAIRQDWAAAHKSALSPDLKTMLDAINRDIAR